ncbi:DUF357 domain-containing protein [Candidatus Micrarchaeota archaeon]|nr:DUF357 domain-containing protein [Candidatus Micrarchaeota archaeon]
MEPEERAKKDIEKLERIIAFLKHEGLDSQYSEVMGFIENYYSDAKHFYSQGDHFTAFGAANYAYGFADAILVIEGKKDEQTVF